MSTVCWALCYKGGDLAGTIRTDCTRANAAGGGCVAIAEKNRDVGCAAIRRVCTAPLLYRVPGPGLPETAGKGQKEHLCEKMTKYLRPAAP